MKTNELLGSDCVTNGLIRYDESAGDNQQRCSITEIVVPTERDKDQLIKAFHYIHTSRKLTLTS